MVAEREIDGKLTTDSGYDLLRRAFTPQRSNSIVRCRWTIEKQMHWILDVAFDDDRARNREDHGRCNLKLLHCQALIFAKLEPFEAAERRKLKRVGWDNKSLTLLLNQFAHLHMGWPGKRAADGLDKFECSWLEQG